MTCAEQNAIRLLTVLASIPEAERLDALTIMLDVWVRCPTLCSSDLAEVGCERR